LRDATALTARLALQQPGDEIELTVFRDGQSQRFTAQLGEFDNQPRPTTVAHEPAASGWRLGFDVAPLTPSLAREFDRSARDAGVTAPDSGVVIATVDDNSPASRANLRPGQLVLTVNGQPVHTVADMQAIAGDLRAGAALSLRLLDQDLGETIVNYRIR
jgi:serine protease Do